MAHDVSLRPSFNPNQVLSLPEMVYLGLRNAILNGVFAPGQMLRQEDVATRLGVSRSPLREALPRLEAEGIVVLHPRRGYAVATLDPKDIVEAFDLKILIERELARRAIALRTAADIAKTQQLLQAMTPAAAGVDGDLSDWFELNGQFHQALLTPANCPQHMRALTTTRGVIEAYIRAEVRLTGDMETAQFEHTLMAQTFANGDAEAFMRLIREHSEHTRIRLLEGLARSSSAAPAKEPKGSRSLTPTF